MTTARTHIASALVLFLVLAVGFLAFAHVTDAQSAQNTCAAPESNKTVSGTTTFLNTSTSMDMAGCTQAANNLRSSVNCGADSQSITIPGGGTCYPYPDGSGWACADAQYTQVSTYYGTGAITSSSDSTQSATMCPYVPDPTVTLTASSDAVPYGGTATISWSSTNAATCSSSEFSTNYTPTGSAQVTLNGAGSSKTYHITCLNGYGTSATDSTTITITNPAAPASCSPWDTTQTDSGGLGTYYTQGSVVLESSGYGSSPTAQSCMNACSAYSTGQGATYTCGLHYTAELYGFGGPSYNGSSGSQEYTLTCTATPGTTTYPSYYYSFSSTQIGGGGNMITSDDPSYWQTIQNSGCFGPTPTQTCAVYEYTQSDSGETTCTFTPPTVPPTVTLTADPSTIAQGDSSTLTWSSTNANSCSGVNFSTGGATGDPTPATTSVTPAATTNYSVTCTGDGGTATASTTVTVTTVTKPDLTAANVTQSSATAGTPINLTAKITNGGNATTGTGFYNLFQRATDSSGSNATDIGTYQRTTALANGGNFTANTSYTFPSAGTWYLRACADKNSASDAGTIPESNESNNCSPGWTVIHVCAAGQTWNGTSCTTSNPPPTCSLSANPTDSVPSTLTWSSTNATSCKGGGFSTGNATSGNVTVNVAGPYTLTCTGAGGTCTAGVNIGGGCGTANPTISADPDRVRKGSTSTITWSASGVDNSCTITENGTTIATVTGNSCNVPTTTKVRTINTQNVYKIICDNEKTAQVVVNLIPAFQEF